MPRKPRAVVPDELMTPAQVCHTLRIDKSTLSRWVSSGRIVPVMDVGMRLFARSDVDRIATERAAS